MKVRKACSSESDRLSPSTSRELFGYLLLSLPRSTLGSIDMSMLFASLKSDSASESGIIALALDDEP